MNFKIQVCTAGSPVQWQKGYLSCGRRWVWDLSLEKRKEMRKGEGRGGGERAQIFKQPKVLQSNGSYFAVLFFVILCSSSLPPVPAFPSADPEFTFLLASVSPTAATRTLIDTLPWSGRHSAATSAVSMLRGSWTTTWTLFSSSKRSWSCGGSLRTAPSPSGWRRCWWAWAAPASPPLSGTWPKPMPEADRSQEQPQCSP